jgi:hypothetical protein
VVPAFSVPKSAREGPNPEISLQNSLLTRDSDMETDSQRLLPRQTIDRNVAGSRGWASQFKDLRGKKDEFDRFSSRLPHENGGIALLSPRPEIRFGFSLRGAGQQLEFIRTIPQTPRILPLFDPRET